uniref:Protein SIEVE ELEMENT OCCLUSION B-like n=1 Tax=Ananas comosus var. bracteatus TaxID=296719 RepID=A0A6V7P1E9_ANACO|nr:unnamed protein product [Ananas comosus var. bracteatus]
MASFAAGMAAAAQKAQPIRGERHLFSASDDSAIIKQILATHTPDGREVDARPLLQVVEDVLQRATPTVVVITCKCSGGSDAHAITLTLFNSLSSYSWDAKVVLALAAFAVSHGEFWLTAQLHTVSPLAKSIALLKQLPDILEHTDILKPRFDAVNNLIRAMLDVTKCIIQFTELPSEYISVDSPDMSTAMAHIPTAVYWTIRSIVACAAQIIGLIGLGHEYITSTTEAWELSSLAHKVSNIHGHLTKQLNLCHRYIDEKKQVESYQNLVRLFDTVHIDNMKILRALVSSKEDHTIFDGTTKRRVSIDVLRRKIVMLYISDLNISNEELLMLVQIYNDIHHGRLERHYEIIWLPITDKHDPWDESKDATFHRLVSVMPWYSAHHPSSVDPVVAKYVREMWHFEKKPLLVVLDPQGRVVCPNALHMIWIWGSLAYPFTSNREEALWKEETWRLEFLIDEIDPILLSSIKEGKYVCLYGSEDIEWIRKFTTLMRHACEEVGVQVEMVYVGKSNPKERVRKVVAAIAAEKLSSYWEDLVMIWFFWVRLESMWHSKIQRGKSVDDDPIMQEVMTMLSFDGSDEGWAVISRGSFEMVKSGGKKLVDCLVQFDEWKASVEGEDGFVRALTTALVPHQTREHCTRLILPVDARRIQEQLVVCAECKRPMEKYVLYRCCND